MPNMFADAVDDLLIRWCPPSTVRAVESGASAQQVASAIAEAGFFELMTPENDGGGGASWSDLFEVVLVAGSRAVPLPLAQTLAARALTSEPTSLPSGTITFAPLIVRHDDGTLHAPSVPFGRVTSHVLAVLDEELVLLDATDRATEREGDKGTLSAALAWREPVIRRFATQIDPCRLQAIGAALHAVLIAGAMKSTLDLTLAYAMQRSQFGRPIGGFQAIQQQMSEMAEHVVASRIAAEAAFCLSDGPPSMPACAVAKARASEAAQSVSAIAHAVHGAIGVTEEYDLQLYTRRLHEWRMAHGSEAHWNRTLGRLFVGDHQRSACDFVRALHS